MRLQGVPTVLSPGDTVDSYVVERVLGEGSHTTVYLVRHSKLGARHALKILRPEQASEGAVRARFVDRGRRLAQLAHPNLVRVTDIIDQGPVAGFVMEYLKGITLGGLFKTSPPPYTLHLCKRIMLGVLAGVGAAHSKGLHHREIDPERIILVREGTRSPLEGGEFRSVVLGLGMADLSEVCERKAPLLASPEQLDGPVVDARSDVFALGALLYQLGTGALPFPGDEAARQAHARLGATGLFSEERAHERQALDDVVASCIHKATQVDPDRRFQSCQSFARRLIHAEDPDRIEQKRAPTLNAAPTVLAMSGDPHLTMPRPRLPFHNQTLQDEAAVPVADPDVVARHKLAEAMATNDRIFAEKRAKKQALHAAEADARAALLWALAGGLFPVLLPSGVALRKAWGARQVCARYDVELPLQGSLALLVGALGVLWSLGFWVLTLSALTAAAVYLL